MNLFRIAARVAVGPMDPAVSGDMRHRTASLYQSGDPAQPGGHGITLKLISGDANEKVLSVNGKIDGQVVSGQITVQIITVQDGSDLNGHEYTPDPGTVDISDDPEMLRIVLDCCVKELNLN